MPQSLYLWNGSISYEGFSFRQVACFYFCSIFFLLCCGGGVIWPVVGRGGGGGGVPFSVSSGFLRVASLSGVTLVN